MVFIRRWADNADGATAIEYALIASLISMVIISGATVIGVQLSAIFTRVNSGFP